MLDARGHYWYRTTNSGYGRKGAPDIYVCVHGLFATIEAKVGKDKPTPWQAREMEAIQNSKGRTCVAYDLATAEKFVVGVETYFPVNWKVTSGDRLFRYTSLEVPYVSE